jgi:hypothetical protein
MIHPASLGSQVLWLVIPPALIILGISAGACLRRLPRWLLGLSCGVCILGFLLQWLGFYWIFLACKLEYHDVC